MASLVFSTAHPHPPPPLAGEEDDATSRQEKPEQRAGEAEPAAAAWRTLDHAPIPLRKYAVPVHAAPKKPNHHRAGAAAAAAADQHVVYYDKCLPSSREKTSVVPVDTACGGHGRSRSASSIPSPGQSGFLRSFFSAFPWRSPGPSCSSPSASAEKPALAAGPVREDEWRFAATELSRRLIHATRKRDEALAESTRIKYSMAELEKKFARLESYTRDLKAALDRGNHNKHRHTPLQAAAPIVRREFQFPADSFLRAVADARSAVRHLGRALAAEMRRGGESSKTRGPFSHLLQQHDPRAAPSGGGDGGGLLLHLEALLSRTLFEDFEAAGFHHGMCDGVLDPRARAKANWASYLSLQGLSWEDVLARGTRHYSESFSRFCDRKMGEVSAFALGDGWWSAAWPEALLRAFFEASKAVWLAHLLAWCDHPPVPVFRVEKGAAFDDEYMEDVAAAAGTARRPAASGPVRLMVSPGFYVQSTVVKSRVCCVQPHAGGGKQTGNTTTRVSQDGRRHGSRNKIGA